MDEILLTEINAGVATVTLNRPKQMNALTAELRRRFGQALEALGADDSVAAVIITGAGAVSGTALPSCTSILLIVSTRCSLTAGAAILLGRGARR